MAGTMTYVGMNVHARSIHATAIDVMTAELTRVRFGAGIETPVDWLKTDRKDAELLARCLMAGSLTPVVVPPPAVEAARELMRAHDACRRDLALRAEKLVNAGLRTNDLIEDLACSMTSTTVGLGRISVVCVGDSSSIADGGATVRGLG